MKLVSRVNGISFYQEIARQCNVDDDVDLILNDSLNTDTDKHRLSIEVRHPKGTIGYIPKDSIDYYKDKKTARICKKGKYDDVVFIKIEC